MDKLINRNMGSVLWILIIKIVQLMFFGLKIVHTPFTHSISTNIF